MAVVVACILVATHQFCGNNAVILYSSSFLKAGTSGELGRLVPSIINF